VSGSGFFPSPAPAPFPVYPNPQTPVGLPDGLNYSSQASPVSPGFHNPGASPANQLPPQLHDMMGPNAMNFGLMEPTNPGIFNFDLEGTDFTSRYGALEWHILGHMSSGAVETPSREASISQTPGQDATPYASMFNSTPNLAQFGPIYDPNSSGMVDMMGLEHASAHNGVNNNNNNININNGGGNVVYANGNLQHGLPHAYAIATGPANLASPSESDNTASPQPANVHGTISPSMTPFPGGIGITGPPPNLPMAVPRPKPRPASNARHRSNGGGGGGSGGPGGGGGGGGGGSSLLGKKKRDASWIYTISEPYSYLASFHNLFNYLETRFPVEKKMHIAKHLASIRPSFMSCMKTLNKDDLVMMERVFQRTLVTFESFLDQNSSPAIVCRRTGEVVAVNNQFTAVTGWTKDVLLGNEPNLNTNTGDSSNGGAHFQSAQLDNGKNQPVFIAELLDDDSVAKFYEDFALLAFEDSRGVRQRKGRLLKYRPGEENIEIKAESLPPRPQIQVRDQSQGGKNGILSNRVTRIDGEHGISRIEKDGKVECTYCWYIKRDPFDMPMMIVMNFLPCYDRAQTHLPV
jgi:PAS domain-containing protein